jgi:hypothetical protein
VNRIIIHCAEELVFFRDDHTWIEGFVRDNSDYRIESATEVIRHGTSFRNAPAPRVIFRQKLSGLPNLILLKARRTNKLSASGGRESAGGKPGRGRSRRST